MYIRFFDVQNVDNICLVLLFVTLDGSSVVVRRRQRQRETRRPSNHDASKNETKLITTGETTLDRRAKGPSREAERLRRWYSCHIGYVYCWFRVERCTGFIMAEGRQKHYILCVRHTTQSILINFQSIYFFRCIWRAADIYIYIYIYA